MRLPPAISAGVRAYVAVLRSLAGLSMAIIVVVMIAQVWARYVMGGSLIWAEELCRYLLLWQTFLVLGLAYSRGEFVSLDFLPAALSERGRWVLKAVCAVPIVAFLAVVTYYGADYASRFSSQTIPALDFIWGSLTGHSLGISIKYVYYSVAVGSALMILHVIADVVSGYGDMTAAAKQDGLDDTKEVSSTGGRQG
ncbi:TRAP transporter small permease [Salipiger bermudensis]|uniref:TRAP transporter small permease n=1 Tax=Salipiger bermudensis TaxID=344736 RepID=UPI001CD4585E|nr:TRAP transporter small permease [Salipiger bermudensis]MCA0963061.1 TRAP transporter small permease [Salipiger bermudensis]